MIDPHVHLRDWKQSDKETLEHGIAVASSLGIDVLFDMPNTDPPLIDTDAVYRRIAEGRKIAHALADHAKTRPVWYGVYGGLTPNPGQIRAMVDAYYQLKPAMVGLKLFAGHSTGGMGIVDKDMQASVYDILVRSDYQGVLAVHCEKESLLNSSRWDPKNPASHCEARPAEAEIQSVADQIESARSLSFKGILHICHISTAASIALVVNARKQGMKITCGATPHHALLDKTAASRSGHLLKMNPPLRSKEDMRAVFNALLDGSIDWIESDHAPHTLQDKSSGASGIPGFAGYVLLTAMLRNAGASEKQLQAVCGERLKQAWDMPELPSVAIPDMSGISSALCAARTAYAWDPFDSIELPAG